MILSTRASQFLSKLPRSYALQQEFEILSRFRDIGVDLTPEQLEARLVMQGLSICSPFSDTWWHGQNEGVFAEDSQGGKMISGFIEEDAAGGYIAPNGNLCFDFACSDPPHQWRSSVAKLLEMEALLENVLHTPRPVDFRCTTSVRSYVQLYELLKVRPDEEASDVDMLFPQDGAVSILLRYETAPERGVSTVVVLATSENKVSEILQKLGNHLLSSTRAKRPLPCLSTP